MNHKMLISQFFQLLAAIGAGILTLMGIGAKVIPTFIGSIVIIAGLMFSIFKLAAIVAALGGHGKECQEEADPFAQEQKLTKDSRHC